AGSAPLLRGAGRRGRAAVLPLAATAPAPAVVAAFDTADPARTFFHGHSFTAHPLACAVACVNWRMMRRPDALDAPRRMEAFWREALAPLRGRPGVRDVRVRGSIAAVELDVPGGYLAAVGRPLPPTCPEARAFP